MGNGPGLRCLTVRKKSCCSSSRGIGLEITLSFFASFLRRSSSSNFYDIWPKISLLSFSLSCSEGLCLSWLGVINFFDRMTVANEGMEKGTRILGEKGNREAWTTVDENDDDDGDHHRTDLVVIVVAMPPFWPSFLKPWTAFFRNPSTQEGRKDESNWKTDFQQTRFLELLRLTLGDERLSGFFQALFSDFNLTLWLAW